jgi:hypothetical protein
VADTGRTHSPDEHVWQPNGFDAEECSCGATRLADGTVVEWQPGGAPTPEQAYAEGRVQSRRFPKVKGGCRVRSCVRMAHTCPSRWHRLLNIGVRHVA